MRTFLLILLIPNVAFAQLEDSYNTCLKNFYKLLYQENVTIQELNTVLPTTDYADSLFVLERLAKAHGDNSYLKVSKNRIIRPANSISYIMLELKKHRQELTQGLSLDSVCKIIDQSKEHGEPDEFSQYVELTFPNNHKVFFDLSTETPSFINWIWLNNGDLLNAIIYRDIPVVKMKWVGMINDKDGFVNVREAPEQESKIVRKIGKNEIFYYTPIGDSDWWPISTDERGAYIGYIHKSEVLIYPNFPKEVKDKLKKGC